MPPRIAALLYTGFIVYLFVSDYRHRERASWSVWIPLLWMLINGSRPVSYWFNGPSAAPQDYFEGSPFDRNVYTALILAGVMVLLSRGAESGRVARGTAVACIFIAYCGVSVIWADYPFVSFKRWIKEFGALVMVFVVWTDPRPVDAARAVLRRAGFILIPLSVLFIKYYPDLGREYSRFTWEASFSGVTDSKNSLGQLCWVLGLFLVWTFTARLKEGGVAKKVPRAGRLLLLVMVAWLLQMANSATSLVCFVLTSAIVVGARILKINYAVLGRILLSFVIVAVGTVSYLGLEAIVPYLGRDATLTGRTDIWQLVLQIKINSIIGTGYESFWIAERIQALTDRYSFPINQSHNGYLEIYLSLGYIGLVLFGAMLASSYRRVSKLAAGGSEFAVFCLACLIGVIMSNVTEAGVRGTSFMWFMLLLTSAAAADTRTSHEALERSYSTSLRPPLLRRPSSGPTSLSPRFRPDFGR